MAQRRRISRQLACKDTRQVHQETPEALVVPQPSKLLGLSPAAQTDDDEARGQQRRVAGPKETTLLIRNIPMDFTLEQLLEEFLLAGQSDLFFLPSVPEKRMGSGCAIVNFTSEEAAGAFWKRWQGQCLSLQSLKSKPLRLRRARTQGFWENLRKISKSVREKLLKKYFPVAHATTRSSYQLMFRTVV